MGKIDKKLNVDLVEVLEKEYKLYKKLNSLAHEKKDAIVENDVENLVQLLEEDNEVIEGLKGLESRREEIIEKITKEMGFAQEEIKIKDLTNKMESPWRNKFMNIREKLIEIIDSLHQQNGQNKILVEEALKINQFSVNIIHKLLEPESTYNLNEKSTETSNVNHIVDRKG